MTLTLLAGGIFSITFILIVTVRLTRAALPAMIANANGAIINVSSLAALLPLRNVTYAATKGYLVTFSEALQNELRGSGVRVQALCPGFTYTEFHDQRILTGFRRKDIPQPLWGKADQVVTESLKALGRDQVIVIPGLINRLIVAIGRNAFTGPLVRFGARALKRKKK